MRRHLVVLVVLVALVAAACGGSSGGDTGGGSATTVATTAPGGDGGGGGGAGDAANGEKLYQGTCVACHGPDAKGVTGLGKDLTTSEFAKGLSDEELVAFLKTGRPASDPANTTGVDMPPKGGNPSLSDDDLLDIVAYLRTLE